jgi:hypothetical protein
MMGIFRLASGCSANRYLPLNTHDLMFAPLMTPLSQAFGVLEQHQTVEFLAKDILGANLPKTLAVRNRDERIEVGFVQFGATVGYVALGLLAEKLGHAILNLAEKGVTKGTQATSDLRVWGQSAGIYPVLAGFFFAMPYLRNLLTAHRTHKTSFTDVVGETQQQSSADSEAQFQAKVRHDRRVVQWTATLALGAASLGLGTAALAIRRGAKASPQWAARLSHWSLDKGQFMGYKPMAQLFGLIVPIYIAALSSARDRFEVKEQLLSFATFVGFFFGPQPLIRKAFAKAYQKAAASPQAFEKLMKHPQSGEKLGRVLHSQIVTVFKNNPAVKTALERVYVTENVVGLLLSILLLGVSPNLLNIYLTRQRVKQAKATEQLRQQPQLFQAFLDQVQTQRQTQALQMPRLFQQGQLA